MPTVLTDAPTSLYRFFDGDGKLLYIGVTARGSTRAAEHARTKEWWPLVATSAVEHFPNRRSALRAERDEIAKWQPPYNTIHRRPGAAPLQPTVERDSELRSIMGRTSRLSSLADVDLDWLTQELPHTRPVVARAYWSSVRENETLSEFRERLKQATR